MLLPIQNAVVVAKALTGAALLVGLLAMQACAAAAGPVAAKPEGKGLLTATLVANKEAYTLDPAQSGPAFRKQLADLSTSGNMAPPTPAVDLTLRLTNTGNKDLTIPIGGDATQIDLKLAGPGAVTVHNNVMMSMIFRMGKPVTIAPGKDYELKISSLSFGKRNMSEAAYWTEPGDYTLTATFTCRLEDGTLIEAQSTPAKVKVEKAAAPSGQ